MILIFLFFFSFEKVHNKICFKPLYILITT